MDNKTKTIQQLVTDVISEMERIGYSRGIIKKARSNYNNFMLYAVAQNTEFYSEALATEYFKDKFSIDITKSDEPLSSHQRDVLKNINRLGNYRMYGCFNTNTALIKNQPDWRAVDKPFIEAYLNDAVTADDAAATKASRLARIKRFYDFLAFRGVESICNVESKDISDFVLSLHGYSRSTVANILSGVRLYARFLYKSELIKLDIEALIPKTSAKGNLNIPALWSKDEILSLLKGIDRNNASGKRDYAILLIISQLGLRCSDIVSLELKHLNWNNRTIERQQHKTRKPLLLPMPDDVGWAIIDYIRDGRPNIDNPYLFITANAPYREFETSSSIDTILRKRMKASGLRRNTERPRESKGPHSLRHALVRRLAEQKTPLATMVGITGHTSYDAVQIYARVGIEGLRTCALSIDIDEGDAANA